MKKRKRKSNYWALRIKSVLSRVRICQGCGDGYVKKKHSGHKEGEKYCSRECASKNSDKWPKSEIKICKLPEYSKIHTIKCPNCHNLFVSKQKKKYCSYKCSIIAADKTRQRKNAKTNCVVCGAIFSRLWGNSSRTCSDACKVESVRKARRKFRSLRRAKIRAGQHEPFDPFVVLRRDGYKCQACGCDTPPELRNQHKPNSPELDHIIPLSKGGEHTIENTQCLCKSCNGIKSNMTMRSFMLTMCWPYDARTANDRRAKRTHGQGLLL